MLCALTATACTDTLEEAALPKPLSVDVNARDITARAPIHGTALPDASSIGISLLAEDGTPYDGVTYANLKYTASGTAPDQTWSTPNIPTLSSTSAKLVAYYPWADGTDYTAVPVETDTQTDYMYSKWLTGLSNASSNASIVMQHALTAVRVALVKGDFTADVDVSSVSVKSPAFATAGSLDATTGALSGLTGTGEAVTVTADFPLTAQATNVEVMAVPDVSVAAGVTTVTTQIGDRKYSVNINFIESYKQGYIYTYTLTLNNTGMEVTSVAVTPWQEGTTGSGDLGVELDNDYIVKIEVPENGYTFTHNLVDFVGDIDWGDGTTSTYTEVVSSPTHIYTTAGEYTVTCTGKMTGLSIADMINMQLYSNLFESIVEIIHIGGDMGVTRMDYAFMGCSGIAEIPQGIFNGLTEVTTFEGMFYACENITEIPQGLFDKCTEVIDFTGTFAACGSLTNIPEGLFDNNTKVTSFNSTFAGCAGITEIPEGLFDYNPEVTSFEAVFSSSAITTIPDRLFDNCPKVTSFATAFSTCEALTAIPEGLFDNNTEVIDFSYTFRGCFSLTAIPEGLFDKCTAVNNFAHTFDNCVALTNIPEGLFDYNTKVTTFWQTFSHCVGLVSIPEGLFDNCPEVITFEQTFWNCSKLKSIPEGLFDNNTKVITFNTTFYGCSELTNIPVGLFDNCPNVTNFDHTFFECKKIKNIPEGLFDNCPNVTNFSCAFYNCEGLTSIPTGLFDKCTKVTSFYSTFRGAVNLTGESPYTIINVDGADVKVHLYERSLYPAHFTTPTDGINCYFGADKLDDIDAIKKANGRWWA